jgi:hypothetical protein
MVKQDKERNIRHIINLVNWGEIESVAKRVLEEEKRKQARKINCWVCGKSGKAELSYVGRKLYLYCFHYEGKGKIRKCYLGRVDKIFLAMLEETLSRKQKEEEQQGGENK